jgi:hypothetical protein
MIEENVERIFIDQINFMSHGDQVAFDIDKEHNAIPLYFLEETVGEEEFYFHSRLGNYSLEEIKSRGILGYNPFIKKVLANKKLRFGEDLKNRCEEVNRVLHWLKEGNLGYYDIVMIEMEKIRKIKDELESIQEKLDEE